MLLMHALDRHKQFSFPHINFEVHFKYLCLRWVTFICV